MLLEAGNRWTFHVWVPALTFDFEHLIAYNFFYWLFIQTALHKQTKRLAYIYSILWNKFSLYKQKEKKLNKQGHEFERYYAYLVVMFYVWFSLAVFEHGVWLTKRKEIADRAFFICFALLCKQSCYVKKKNIQTWIQTFRVDTNL